MKRSIGHLFTIAALTTSILPAACGESDPSGPGPTPTATVSGVVTAAAGAVIEGATVKIGTATATTGADGRFELQSLPVGSATITTSAPGFDSRSESLSLAAGTNTHDVTLTPTPTASISGVVTATTGAVMQGASVSVGSAVATTGADGRFELQNLPVGGATIITSAAGFVQRSQLVGLVAGANTHDVVLAPAGQWGIRAPLLEANSELALAEAGGKLYLLGGYPASRVTARTVQVYDIASNSWTLGPPLPQPNNHGMAVGVNGKVYLIGGQTSDVSDQGYVNTVYELDPAVGDWVVKAPMPTARGAGVAVALDGKIYVAGGRPPRGHDFAVYDPATNSWETLPNLPTQRNHFTGAAIGGRIHFVGGRLGHGLSLEMTTAHEVYDPQTQTWTTAAPMLQSRSGMNGVMARGCFHVWGGEGPSGMFPDHDYYDSRTNQWIPLGGMPTPVHGVYGSAFVDGLIRVPGGGTGVGGNQGSSTIVMGVSISVRTLALAFVTSIAAAACAQGDPTGPAPTAAVSGSVTAATGAVVAGASVAIGSATATTAADGRFELENLPVGSATMVTSAPGFAPRSESLSLTAGTNAHDVVLTPTPTASVSGVVKAATGAVIAGASVSVGSATSTTGADGRFEVQNLPVGSVTISTSAPRFDQRIESISLNEGENVRDVVLEPQTLFTYQNVVAYLPRGIAEYKAAIVFLPGLRDPATGNDLDSRALVRGTSESGCSIWCLSGERTEVRRQALELAGGNVALIGTTTLVDNPASYGTLLLALSDFGTQSLHPELANIPIFFVGHSMGGCTAYGFSRVHGARVAGFLTMKGACHNLGPALEATAVPGHFLIGNLDEPYRRENITAVFEAGRAAGAPWALSIDPFHHGPILDFDLMFDWIDAVLTARLPETPGAPLRAVTVTAGWLGDRSSGAISSYACYGSSPSSASWLPSEETALDWQRMAGGSVVVGDC